MVAFSCVQCGRLLGYAPDGCVMSAASHPVPGGEHYNPTPAIDYLPDPLDASVLAVWCDAHPDATVEHFLAAFGPQTASA